MEHHNHKNVFGPNVVVFLTAPASALSITWMNATFILFLWVFETNF